MTIRETVEAVGVSSGYERIVFKTRTPVMQNIQDTEHFLARFVLLDEFWIHHYNVEIEILALKKIFFRQ